MVRNERHKRIHAVFEHHLIGLRPYLFLGYIGVIQNFRNASASAVACARRGTATPIVPPTVARCDGR